MRLKPIIDRLRTRVVDLAKVGGSVDLGNVNVTTVAPAAYVVPLTDTAAPNRTVNAVSQRVAMQFGVVVVASNVRREGGEAGFDDELDALRTQIRNALINWEHPDADDVVTYVGGQLLSFDGQVIFWNDRFETAVDVRVIA